MEIKKSTAVSNKLIIIKYVELSFISQDSIIITIIFNIVISASVSAAP